MSAFDPKRTLPSADECVCYDCLMDGVHDMGGMDGFGKIEVEENEPVFHAAWEGHVPRYAASHDLRRCLAYRPSALRGGAASANNLSERDALPALASRNRKKHHRARLRDSRGTQGRPCHN